MPRVAKTQSIPKFQKEGIPAIEGDPLDARGRRMCVAPGIAKIFSLR
jgi:hypothetical protein